MKHIKTGQTRSDAKRKWLVMVDDDDYEVLSKFNWQVDKYGTVYSHKTDKGRILIHRYITNCPKDLEVDHIDGNRLNNQKSNLRLVSSSQNKMNRGARKDCKSGYKGVSWNTKNNNWNARIKTPTTYKHLGVFTTKEEAAEAYNKAAKFYFGEYAWLNKL